MYIVELAVVGCAQVMEASHCTRVEFNFASPNYIPNAQLLLSPPRSIFLVFDIFVFVDPVVWKGCLSLIQDHNGV